MSSMWWMPNFMRFFVQVVSIAFSIDFFAADFSLRQDDTLRARSSVLEPYGRREVFLL